MGSTPIFSTNMESWRTRLARWSEKPDTLVQLQNFPPKYGVSSLMVEHQIVSLACVDSSSTFRPIKTAVYLMRHNVQGSRIDN